MTEEDDNEFEFGGTLEGELDEDLRPVFARARALAVERFGPEVTVTDISYVH